MLQIGLDFILGDATNLLSTCVSILVGLYLLYLWSRQENRLLTDLPLAFGLSFLFASINTFILLSIGQGILPDTLDIFKVRAFSVWLSVFPMSIVLLDVWLYRHKKRHKQLLALESAYAILVCLFGPSEQIIMSLIIILVLIIIIALTAMFVVTWKTGRLKEVRSDFMIVAMVLMIVSQLVLMPLQAQGLAFIAYGIRGTSTVIAGLALSNPWFRRKKSSPTPTYTEVDSLEPSESIVDSLKTRLSDSSLLRLALFLLPVFYILREVDIYIWNVDETAINVMPSKVLSTLILLGIFWYLRNNEFKPVLGLSRVHMKWFIALGVVFAVTEYFLVNIVSTAIYIGFIDPSVTVQFVIAMDAFLVVYNFILFSINAVFEESFFRGLTYHGFKGRFGVHKAIVAAAIIFGFWHIAWPIQEFIMTGVFPLRDAFVKVAFSGILGGMFSVWYVKFAEEKTLMGPIAAHTLINYLNEGFKVVPPELAEEGPDLSFLSPVHMAIGLSFVLAVFIFCYIVFWRYRMSDVFGESDVEIEETTIPSKELLEDSDESIDELYPVSRTDS